MITRIPRWESALMQYIHAEIGQPFIWGTRDCTLFALGACQALTGNKIILPELNYNDMKSAMAQFKALEHGVFEGIKAQCETVEPDPGFEQLGDLIIYDVDGFEACHVVFDHRFITCDPATGVTFSLMSSLPPNAKRLRIL